MIILMDNFSSGAQDDGGLQRNEGGNYGLQKTEVQKSQDSQSIEMPSC